MKSLLRTLLVIVMGGVLLSVSFSSSVTHAASGADFRAGRIIDDSVFTNKNSMTADQIQIFLNAKVPSCDRWRPSSNPNYQPPWTCLKEYQENPITGENNLGPEGRGPNGEPRNIPGGLSAAQIIWNAAQEYSINPQVILVTLQKEQSLVTDDWPWAIQYWRAMGNRCPDGPGGAQCDPNYAGFYKQVYGGAWQFRHDFNGIGTPGFWSPYRVGLNNILYQDPNANPNCGTKSVYIENQATAVLYKYTPYTPNQAALDNLYGTGDTCSSYGNRNFWRLFTDWFGATRQGEFSVVVASDLSDLTQYVLLDNTLYAIPNPDIKEAWGLLNKTLNYMEPSYLASLSRGPSLGRVGRANGDLGVWFLDQGKRYRFTTYEMMLAWGYNSSSIANVPASLMFSTLESGNLSYSIYRQNNGENYLMDGGVLRRFNNQQTLQAWDGDGAAGLGLSSTVFSIFPEGTVIDGYSVRNNGSNYIVNRGTKLTLNASISSVFGFNEGIANNVSDATINRLYGVQTSFFLRPQNSQTVYLIDAGQKRAVLSPDLLTSWAPGRNPIVTVTSTALINYFPEGTPIGDYFASDGTRTRLIDGSLLTIKSTLSTDYTRTPIAISQSLMNMYSEQGTSTRFIRSTNPNNPSIYIVINGKRYHIGSIGTFLMWGGGNVPVTSLGEGPLNTYPLWDTVDTFVGNSGNIYLVDSGRLVKIEGDASSTWDGAQPIQISNGLAQDMNIDAKVLSGKIDGEHGDYYLSKGILYVSQSAAMSDLWRLGEGPWLSNYATSRFTTRRILTKFAKSSDNNDLRIFINDDIRLITLTSPSQVYNLGYQNETPVLLAPNTISSSQKIEWHTPIAKDNIGQFIVFDQGSVRTFADILTRDQWMYQQTDQPIISDKLLRTFQSKPVITKSIKKISDPKVYAVTGLVRQHVTNLDLYTTAYSPFTTVSDWLVDSIGIGNPL